MSVSISIYLSFWPCSMQNLSPLSRDQTCTFYSERAEFNHRTTSEVTACLCICVSIHVSICIYVSIIYGSNNHLCIYLCIYVCTNQSSVYLCPCVCMHYLCIYLYSHLCIYQSFYAPICVSVCYLSQEMFLEFYFNIVPPWTSGLRSSLVAQTVKHLPVMQETWV